VLLHQANPIWRTVSVGESVAKSWLSELFIFVLKKGMHTHIARNSHLSSILLKKAKRRQMFDINLKASCICGMKCIAAHLFTFARSKGIPETANCLRPCSIHRRFGQ
jgi:hypothetical protein